MNYAIDILTEKKLEINKEIDRVQRIKTPNPDYKKEFDEGKSQDVQIMNDKVKQLNRSLNILKEFNT